MTRHVELEVAGVMVTAALRDDIAPKTASAFWEILPIEHTLRHVRWGGNGAYVIERKLRDEALFPLENRIAFYFPNTIALKPEHGEIAFSYGQAQARSLGGNGWAVHFADIVDGDRDRFMTVLARTQREGGKPIVMRRKEG
jgi:Protein of unknown function (DUF3830)